MGNNFKGTQGEWHVSKMVTDWEIYTEKRQSIAAAYEYSRSIPKEEAEANAKLIAAAPELLEALQKVREMISLKDGRATLRTSREFVNEVIESAIQKATSW